MKTVKTAKEARAMINDKKDFKMEVSLTNALKRLIKEHVSNASAGIVLETGEVIVLTAFVVVVGSVVAYAIYKGYRVRFFKEGDKWYLEFTKIRKGFDEE